MQSAHFFDKGRRLALWIVWGVQLTPVGRAFAFPSSTPCGLVRTLQDPLAEAVPLNELVQHIFAYPPVSAEQRAQNALTLDVDVVKFQHVSAAQLEQQWGGSELTLRPENLQVDFAPYGRVSSPKRGDKVKLRRFLVLDNGQLQELKRIGVVTSRALSRVNFDLSELDALIKSSGITMAAALQRTWISGRLGIPTSYAYGERLNGIRDRLLHNTKPGEHFIELEFQVPAEAFVMAQRGHALPPHVVADPVGYGFVEPHGDEAEVTFLDFIPRQWLVTDVNSLP